MIKINSIRLDVFLKEFLKNQNITKTIVKKPIFYYQPISLTSEDFIIYSKKGKLNNSNIIHYQKSLQSKIDSYA